MASSDPQSISYSFSDLSIAVRKAKFDWASAAESLGGNFSADDVRIAFASKKGLR